MRVSARVARGTVITIMTVTCITGAVTYAIVQPEQPSSQPGTCNATQPVYSSKDEKLVGSWQATLTVGQEVLLPDGDAATCTTSGLDVEQP